MRKKGQKNVPLIAVVGKIVLKKIEEPKKEGSLILPDTNKNEPYIAKVVSANTYGNYSTRDVVYVPYYAGVKVKHTDDQEYIIIKEEEILCKVRK